MRNLVVTGSTHTPRLCVYYGGSEPYGVYTPGRMEFRGDGDRLLEEHDGPISLIDLCADGGGARFRNLRFVGAVLWNSVVGPFVATIEGTTWIPSWISPESELKLTIPPTIDPVTPIRRVRLDEEGLIVRSACEGLFLGQAGDVYEEHSANWNFCGFTIASLRRFASSEAGSARGGHALLDVELFDVVIE